MEPPPHPPDGDVDGDGADVEGPPRVGYLGPPGTFSEEALRSAASPDRVEAVAMDTFHDALVAVRDGALDWALVPIENSVEGPFTATLDTLASLAGEVEIAGELVLGVHHCLIARAAAELDDIAVVRSHPQAAGQCSIFLHQELPGARVVAASSTAEAVRLLAEPTGAQEAAIGTRLAAALYGCVVVRERIEDRPDNETRFVWVGRTGRATSAPPLREADGAAQPPKTSIVFWGAGAEHPGWLVRCLDVFARREINLTKIESRPRRERLGHYMFFADLEGDVRAPAVSEALADLRQLCQEVLVLGSYPAATLRH